MMHTGLLDSVLPLDLAEGKKLTPKYREMYLSRAQQLIYNFGARETYIRAGRGFGKTSIEAPFLTANVQTIPRGLGAFLGSSLKQLYCKTMPNMVKSLETMLGWKEGMQYFRGHAPKRSGYVEPLVKPRVWENALHFYNGAVMIMVSMEQRASANSYNLCWLMGDEVRFFNWQKVLQEVIPALRGDVYDHPGWSKKNPRYLSQTWCSDSGLTLAQQEWESAEDDQTEEVNQQIVEMLAEQQHYMEEYGIDLSNSHEFPEWSSRLQELRCQSLAFFNFSSLENIEILGEDYIARMERQLPKLVFDRQIMGKRTAAAKDGYYSSFDVHVHGYAPREDDQTEVIQKKFMAKHKMMNGDSYKAPDLDALQHATYNCVLDTDVVPGLPLRIAFDYNKNINTVVTGQQYKMDGVESVVVLSSMYVKNEQKLRELCRKWCRYYEPHKATCNDVIYYYDATAKQGGTYALEEQEKYKFYNVVNEELTARGWHVIMVDMKTPMRHDQKYQFLNDVMSGQQQLFFRINVENNEYLIVAMENAKVATAVDKNGHTYVKKDKGREKYRSSSPTAGPLEERTDISDAADTLIIGCRFYGFGGRGFSAASFGGKMRVSRPVMG